MAKKFFTRFPSSVMGLIFVLGSMLDGIAVSQMMDKNIYIGVCLMALRAGINKIELLYTVGLTAGNPEK